MGVNQEVHFFLFLLILRLLILGRAFDCWVAESARKKEESVRIGFGSSNIQIHVSAELPGGFLPTRFFH